MITFKNISIVIPVGPGENALDALLKDLRPIEKEAEVIVIRGSSRSRQLNDGARQATRDFLWFLHADSRFTKSTLRGLIESLHRDPNALHYFDLRFLKDGPPQMGINEIGCWIRSRLMKLPFGDQGFCLSRENFELIGGFPEDVSYGEDHVFVWHARQKNIFPQSTGSILKTSARKYKGQGWWNTTKLYYKLWTQQARPERERLKRIKKKQSTALAVFVKTPGITPAKTRLSQTIGKGPASEFYELCLQSIQKTLSVVQTTAPAAICPYWAVAEKRGLTDRRWQTFGRLTQGEGDLGERLHCVYATLQSIHKNVILIGADAPHVSGELIMQAHQLLQDKKTFMIGPARDGGFYLFGGSITLPKEVWTSVAYSKSQTCNDLVGKIKNFGEVVFLPALSDVDVAKDLPHLMQEMQGTDHPGNDKIRKWIKTTLPQEVS